jgi:hypothetical protein
MAPSAASWGAPPPSLLLEHAKISPNSATDIAISSDFIARPS